MIRINCEECGSSEDMWEMEQIETHKGQTFMLCADCADTVGQTIEQGWREPKLAPKN